MVLWTDGAWRPNPDAHAQRDTLESPRAAFFWSPHEGIFQNCGLLCKARKAHVLTVKTPQKVNGLGVVNVSGCGLLESNQG